MSYIKISQLPAATGVTDDDYLVIVDDPDGAPITRKITAEDLIDTVLTEIDGGNIS